MVLDEHPVATTTSKLLIYVSGFFLISSVSAVTCTIGLSSLALCRDADALYKYIKAQVRIKIINSAKKKL